MSGLPAAGAVVHEERAVERRNAASRANLLLRVMAEFAEMPGLRLTHAQARRLSGLREDVSVRVLAALSTGPSSDATRMAHTS